MRDNKILINFQKRLEKEYKEMQLFKNLKKEVEANANGTREYVIKKGINKGKLAKWILQTYLKRILYLYQ